MFARPQRADKQQPATFRVRHRDDTAGGLALRQPRQPVGSGRGLERRWAQHRRRPERPAAGDLVHAVQAGCGDRHGIVERDDPGPRQHGEVRCDDRVEHHDARARATERRRAHARRRLDEKGFGRRRFGLRRGRRLFGDCRGKRRRRGKRCRLGTRRWRRRVKRVVAPGRVRDGRRRDGRGWAAGGRGDAVQHEAVADANRVDRGGGRQRERQRVAQDRGRAPRCRQRGRRRGPAGTGHDHGHHVACPVPVRRRTGRQVDDEAPEPRMGAGPHRGHGLRVGRPAETQADRRRHEGGQRRARHTRTSRRT